MRIVIGGAGEVGRHLAGLLSERAHDVVLVDEDREALASAEEGLDVQVLAGDLASRRVLQRAGADRADSVIAVTGSDDANVLGAALGRSMGARLAVARVDQPSFYEGDGAAEHGLLGIDHLLCTARLVAADLLTQLSKIEATFVHGFASGSAVVALWTVAAHHAACGAIPAELSLGRVRLGGVARDGFVRLVREAGSLEPGDVLILAGGPEPVAAAFDKLRGQRRARRCVVVGGGEVGAIVASTLAGRGQRVELVEIDRSRCGTLAETLPQIDVLHGDPTDLGFLRDIRFQEADSVVAVTGAEEVNLLTTLMVPHLDRETRGAPTHTFVSVRRHGYTTLCRRLGIEGTTSSFEVLSRGILEAVAPPGTVCSVELPGLSWVAAHLRLPDPLRPGAVVDDVLLSPGAMLLALCRREEVVQPRPGEPLLGGDALLVAAPARELGAIERAVRSLGAEGG